MLFRSLDAEDVKFLKRGMNHFLNAVEKSELIGELSDWKQWKKLRPLTFEEKKPQVLPDLAAFRKSDWVSGGIFSDVASDDFVVLNTVKSRSVSFARTELGQCEIFCTVSIFLPDWYSDSTAAGSPASRQN